MLIGLVVTLPWALYDGVPDVDGTELQWLILAGVGNCAGLLLVYAGVRIGKVGVVAPITSTEGAVAALLAVAAGEQLAAGTGLALAVVAVGIVLAGRESGFVDLRLLVHRRSGRALRRCCRAVVRSEPVRDRQGRRGLAGRVGDPSAPHRRGRGDRAAAGTRRASDAHAPGTAVLARRGRRRGRRVRRSSRSAHDTGSQSARCSLPSSASSQRSWRPSSSTNV